MTILANSFMISKSFQENWHSWPHDLVFWLAKSNSFIKITKCLDGHMGVTFDGRLDKKGYKIGLICGNTSKNETWKVRCDNLVLNFPGEIPKSYNQSYESWKCVSLIKKIILRVLYKSHACQDVNKIKIQKQNYGWTLLFNSAKNLLYLKFTVLKFIPLSGLVLVDH